MDQEKYNKILKGSAYVLAGVGAINWGLGIFNVNLVSYLGLIATWLPNLVYALVGISGIKVLWDALN
jgi:uncharacterized membrane protein YuzA (DUF378 family)